MELLQHIRAAVRAAHDERDLPLEFLAAVEGLDTLPPHGDTSLLETLLLQLQEYDPYAGCGCFGGGTTPAAIQDTLNRLGITPPPPAQPR